jgi:hypothetical protein
MVRDKSVKRKKVSPDTQTKKRMVGFADLGHSPNREITSVRLGSNAARVARVPDAVMKKAMLKRVPGTKQKFPVRQERKQMFKEYKRDSQKKRSEEREKEGRFKVYAYKNKEKTAESAKQIGFYKDTKPKKYKCDDEKKCGAVGKKAKPVKHAGERTFTGSRGGLYVLVDGKKRYVTNQRQVHRKLNN